MKVFKLVFFGLICAGILFACKRNPLKVKLSDVQGEVELVRFDDGLFNLEGKDTLQAWIDFHNEHPDFFNLFTYRIIQTGGIGDEQFGEMMKLFVTDTLVQEVRTKTDNVFSDYDKLEKQLKKAFKYYAYHFPNKELPTIYTYVSGFNQSVVTAENIIGISLDKYLGRDCEYYKQLNSTPKYKVVNMHKDKITSDVAFAWGITEFEDQASARNLLDNMVQNGKLMYLVDAMLPTTEDSLKIGFTQQQLEWCLLNEAQMWTYLIEHELLYSSNRMDIKRYINNAPSTSGFPIDSPGRTGVWIGWQIVRQFMKRNPDTTLEQLMEMKDYQKILNRSGYNPE